MRTIICGIPFKVIMFDRVAADGLYGRMDGKSATIYLDDDMPREMRDATMIHEWIHAVWECNGIQHTEEQVSTMATELYRSGFRVKVEK